MKSIYKKNNNLLKIQISLHVIFCWKKWKKINKCNVYFFFNMNLIMKRFGVYLVKCLWHKLEISNASTFAYVDPLVVIVIQLILVIGVP